MYNVFDLLPYQARVRPDAPFLWEPERVITYGELQHRVNGLRARLIDAGLQAHDRVLIRTNDEVVYISLTLASWAENLVTVPVEYSLKPSALDQLIGIANPHALITCDAANPDDLVIQRRDSKAKPLPAAGDASCAQLLFTSGSSGTPKAVMVTHSGLLAAAVESVDSMALRCDDVQMTTVPFWHAYGQNRGLINTLFAGACIAPAMAENPRLRMEVLKKAAPTILISMPSYYSLLANAPDLSRGRLRAGIAGATSLSPHVKAKFEERYGIPILTSYGLTEFLLISVQRIDRPRPPGSVGPPIRGVQLRITTEDGTEAERNQPGRLYVKGPYVSPGYLGLPDSKKFVDGWLDTEDTAFLDDTGSLHLLGRSASFVKRLGYKVYPIEIENCLLTHPDVADAAVVKRARPLVGEDLVAYAVIREGRGTQEGAILEYCKARLEAYKVPTRCYIVPAIGKLASGKHDLKALETLATS